MTTLEPDDRPHCLSTRQRECKTCGRLMRWGDKVSTRGGGYTPAISEGLTRCWDCIVHHRVWLVMNKVAKKKEQEKP